MLRSDNGGEYTSVEFMKHLKSEGVHHERTVPKNPQQNGVAEHLNRTLIEMTRAMLSGSILSRNLWAEALSTAVYIRNRSPTKAVEDKTPYEAFMATNQMLVICVCLDVPAMLISPRMSARSWT